MSKFEMCQIVTRVTKRKHSIKKNKRSVNCHSNKYEIKGNIH